MKIETLLKKIDFEVIGKELQHGKHGKNYKYFINVKYNNKKELFSFSDSIKNFEDKKPCNFMDVLYCLLLDMHAYNDNKTLKDFAWAYGYSLDDFEQVQKTKNIYNACKVNANKMHELFNDKELSMLDIYFQEY